MASDIIRGQLPADWSCGIGDELEEGSLRELFKSLFSKPATSASGILPTSKKAKTILAGVALAGIGLFAWSRMHPRGSSKSKVSNPVMYETPYKSPSGRIMMSPAMAAVIRARALAERKAA